MPEWCCSLQTVDDFTEIGLEIVDRWTKLHITCQGVPIVGSSLEKNCFCWHPFVCKLRSMLYRMQLNVFCMSGDLGMTLNCLYRVISLTYSDTGYVKEWCFLFFEAPLNNNSVSQCNRLYKKSIHLAVRLWFFNTSPDIKPVKHLLFVGKQSSRICCSA